MWYAGRILWIELEIFYRNGCAWEFRLQCPGVSFILSVGVMTFHVFVLFTILFLIVITCLEIVMHSFASMRNLL